MHTPGPPIDQELLKAQLTTDALYFRLAARRYLRIPVTAISLLVCVLLIVLWVRSYSYWEQVSGRVLNSYQISLSSQNGSGSFMVFRASSPHHKEWKVRQNVRNTVDLKLSPWALFSLQTGFGLRAPYWFLVTVSATIAAIPWLKWRFSLRTLLIVMTLFALFFGAIAMSL